MRFDRIRELAKERDISMNSICRKIGKSSSYLADKQRMGRDIPDEYLLVIAERLNTTPEYLRGETDDPMIRETGNELDELREKLSRLSKEGQAKAEAYLDFLLSQEG